MFGQSLHFARCKLLSSNTLRHLATKAVLCTAAMGAFALAHSGWLITDYALAKKTSGSTLVAKTDLSKAANLGRHKWVAQTQRSSRSQRSPSKLVAASLGGAIATNYTTYCQPSRSSIRPMCGGVGVEIDTLPEPNLDSPTFGFAQFEFDPFTDPTVLFTVSSKPIVLYQYDKVVLVQGQL